MKQIENLDLYVQYSSNLKRIKEHFRKFKEANFLEYKKKVFLYRRKWILIILACIAIFIFGSLAFDVASIKATIALSVMFTALSLFTLFAAGHHLSCEILKGSSHDEFRLLLSRLGMTSELISPDYKGINHCSYFFSLEGIEKMHPCDYIEFKDSSKEECLRVFSTGKIIFEKFNTRNEFVPWENTEHIKRVAASWYSCDLEKVSFQWHDHSVHIDWGTDKPKQYVLVDAST